MVIVSFGKTVKDNKPTPISLPAALERIRTGASKEHVLRIRKLHNGLPDTKDAKQKAKQQSNYVIFQGTFSKRSKNNIIEHSGLAILDLDHVTEKTPEEQKHFLIDAFNFIHAAWVSPSGDGVKAIARIPKVNSDEEYKLYYNKLLEDLQKLTPNGDKSNKDISRICFESFDPDILIKPWDETKIFDIRNESIPKLQTVKRIKELKYPSMVNNNTEAEPILEDYRILFNSLRKGIIKKGHQYIQNNKHNFLFMLIKDCIQFGLNKKTTFALIYEYYTGHDGDLSVNEIKDWGERTWKDNYSDDLFGSKKLTYEIGTITKESSATQSKKHKDPNAVQTAIKYLDYELKHGEVLFNNLSSELIIRDGQRLETLYIEMKKHGMNINKNDLYDLLRENYAVEFDEVSQYFDDLLNKYSYEEVKGSINHLCSYVEAVGTDKNDKEREQKLFNSMLKKHMIRAVGQGRKQFINRFVFVLQQKKQNTGKSTFIKFLNPWGDQKLYGESLPDKDPIMTLAQAFMVNLEELETFNKKDVSHIKAVISKGSDQVRKYYSQIMVTLYRIASLWASTNKIEFLDDSENTRWIILPIERINFDYKNIETGTSEVDIHKCWAEASWCWEYGEKYNPTPYEWTLLESKNQDFAFMNDHDHWVEEYIYKTEYEDKYLSTSTEIANYMRTKGTSASPQKIGQALQKAGYEKLRKLIGGKRIKGYYVMTKDGKNIKEAMTEKDEANARIYPY